MFTKIEAYIFTLLSSYQIVSTVMILIVLNNHTYMF